MIKLYYNYIFISKDVLRLSKLYNKHFKTNCNSTLFLPFFL